MAVMPGSLPPLSSIPAGFDALVQFGQAMLQRVLTANLVDADLEVLGARINLRRRSPRRSSVALSPGTWESRTPRSAISMSTSCSRTRSSNRCPRRPTLILLSASGVGGQRDADLDNRTQHLLRIQLRPNRVRRRPAPPFRPRPVFVLPRTGRRRRRRNQRGRDARGRADDAGHGTRHDARPHEPRAVRLEPAVLGHARLCRRRDHVRFE